MTTKKTTTKKMVETVLVRTTGAGVWMGELAERDNRNVRLLNGYRIWRWRGANTLSEVSQNGVEPARLPDGSPGFTRVAEPVPDVWIFEIHELHICTEKAAESIRKAGWAK